MIVLFLVDKYLPINVDRLQYRLYRLQYRLNIDGFFTQFYMFIFNPINGLLGVLLTINLSRIVRPVLVWQGTRPMADEDSTDDVPQLSTETVNALKEFFQEQQEKEKKIKEVLDLERSPDLSALSFDEDWVRFLSIMPR